MYHSHYTDLPDVEDDDGDDDAISKTSIECAGPLDVDVADESVNSPMKDSAALPPNPVTDECSSSASKTILIQSKHQHTETSKLVSKKPRWRMICAEKLASSFVIFHETLLL